MAAGVWRGGGSRLRLLSSLMKPGIPVPWAQLAAAFSTSVSSGKVAVNGVHLHYQRTGEGEHPVLLLPGMLGSGETDFGPQLKSLSKKLFTVVAWDPRGYGHSRPPDRDFPVDFYERDAKDAVDLMKALNFKKVSLLGWSGGGLTALIAAAKYPAHISKMVIWGAIAYITDEDQRIYEGIRDVSKWSEKARKPLEALYGYDYFAKTCAKWVDGMQQFKHLDGNICRHLLPQVQCPTLIVHGEKDPLVPRFHADFLHKHVRGSQDLQMMPTVCLPFISPSPWLSCQRPGQHLAKTAPLLTSPPWSH
ncbi:valacyclovir hydrolase isoform X2 [Heterocephalus glaber]|uniref:Valacyclovir hydrolase isoform X2 n=1 Tax=Heterocephalus glaber TaxID=10181 RepID=A0AAX6QYA3_HETGA|nr:valacyclovir hydrolase isoform X2 [Heterocephalus glaber]